MDDRDAENDVIESYNSSQEYKEVHDEAETRKRGFTTGSSYKLLQRDIVLVPEKLAEEALRRNAEAAAKNAVA